MSIEKYQQFCINRPDLAWKTMFSESRGTAYMLDPDDPEDMRLLRNRYRKPGSSF